MERIQADAVLVGAGITGATLATLLQQLEPGLTVLIVERLGRVAAESSTFHWFSTKHMDRYVSTFAGRANIRPLDTADQMGWIARNLRGKRLRYRDLLA